MIATLSPALAAPGPQSPARPQACPTDPPAPPTDGIDFSELDTAEKAALLPILEPGVQLGAVAGLLMAMAGAMSGGAAPTVSMAVLTKLNADQDCSVTYQIDANQVDSPVSGAGAIYGQYAGATSTVDAAAGTGTLNEFVGHSQSSLTFKLDEEKEALTASGKIGSVDVDLAFTPLMSKGKGDVNGFHVEGTVGGQPYLIDNMFMGPGATENQQLMASWGRLGETQIKKNYALTILDTPDGAQATIVGGGTFGTHRQEVDVRVTVS
ncbi:MAG: hypothetical protein FJX76_13720 [Armatimonadetes bacterium]|nr:hypothetical protein [Armatimonadota bacterium]